MPNGSNFCSQLARLVVIVATIAALSACATTYHGDRLLELRKVPATYDDGKLMRRAHKEVSELLRTTLELPIERRLDFAEIRLRDVVRSDAALDLREARYQLVLARNGGRILSAFHSIIISGGNLSIMYSGNNVILSAGNVSIRQDGTPTGWGTPAFDMTPIKGSLIVSKGQISLGRPTHTIVYASDGLKVVSQAKDVQALNTIVHKKRWGNIDHSTVEPLFEQDIDTQ